MGKKNNYNLALMVLDYSYLKKDEKSGKIIFALRLSFDRILKLAA